MFVLRFYFSPSFTRLVDKYQVHTNFFNFYIRYNKSNVCTGINYNQDLKNLNVKKAKITNSRNIVLLLNICKLPL